MKAKEKEVTEKVLENEANASEDNNNIVSDDIVEKDELKEEPKKNFSFKRKKNTKKNNEAEEAVKKFEEIKDKYLRLQAEFDNYKKRTLKEKTDLLKFGGESIIKGLLPVIDDFERGIKSLEKTPDEDSVKSGMILIYNKFKDFLTKQSVKEIDCTLGDFNIDEHEAITKFPAQSEEMKGKIIDVVEKGYFYHDKVIRFAKVVVGE